MKHLQGLQIELTDNKELLTKMQSDYAELKVSEMPEDAWNNTIKCSKYIIEYACATICFSFGRQ